MLPQQVGTPAAAAVPLMVGLDFPAIAAVNAGREWMVIRPLNPTI
ncbi:hypothetical protein [Desulfosporosinus meridiei]|nr:hypothetical protein [Desulfosporosinus meridiei]